MWSAATFRLSKGRETMKVLELFAGTRSIGRAFEERGHEVYSIDWDKQFDVDWHADIMTVEAKDILERFGRPDVIWASPDCTSYSVAAMSRHRVRLEDGTLAPRSEYAAMSDRLNQHVHGLIMTLAPRYWFIENPRGAMRKMDFMRGLPRYTVTYCQYGDTRMKPTDIWTNHPAPDFLPMCKNGDPCHESAPRSATVKKMREAGIEVGKLGGTQYGAWSLPTEDRARERARIPEALCRHIVDICER